MEQFYSNKKILITGAAGTVGKELIDQLLGQDIQEIKALDNDEAGLFYLNESYRKEKRYNGFFCNVRDFHKLKYLCNDVDIIFHCAAMKHVIISEMSPLDAMKTNAVATDNVIQAALESDQVSRVIYTSSDKAVNPTNVMGTTKLLGERLVTSAINQKNGKDIVLSSTRFGNVIGSKGSVVPIFYKQIRDGKHVTITDDGMTRFVMTISQAAQLVLESCSIAKGGEVFATKMPVVRIIDLAKAMISLLAPVFGHNENDVQIEYIGSKSGEKLYEELMTEEEKGRAVELANMFAIKPAFIPIYDEVDYLAYESLKNQQVNNPYVSSQEPCLSVEAIKTFLKEHKVLEDIEL